MEMSSNHLLLQLQRLWIVSTNQNNTIQIINTELRGMAFSSISKTDKDVVDDVFGPVETIEEESDLRFSSSSDEELNVERKRRGKRKRKKKRKKQRIRIGRKQRLYMKGKGGVSPDMQSLMVDIGTFMVKCGFAGDDAPRAIFPTIIGYPKNPGIMVGMNAKDCFVGDEAQAKRGILNLTNPVDRGLIKNWEHIEKIFHHTFYNELRVTPEEHPITITEPTMNRKNDRERMIKIMFETFNVPAYYVASQAVLSLYASGRETGICLMSGHGFTSSVPVYEGSPILHAVTRSKVAGGEITQRLVELMAKERNLEMTTSVELEIVRDIKERTGYIALDYDKEKSKNEDDVDIEYELPDGTNLTVKSERFRAPEILFRSKRMGIHHILQESIQMCDKDIVKDLYSNIVLSGGSTMFDGIVERLTKEMTKLQQTKIGVHAPAERKFSVWIGGSILSTLSTFQNKWITMDEYDEAGETIVHRKCFDWTPLVERPCLLHQEEDIHGDSKERVEFMIETYFTNNEKYSRFSVKLPKLLLFVPLIIFE